MLVIETDLQYVSFKIRNFYDSTLNFRVGLLAGPRLLRLMISLLNWGEHIIIFQYKLLNLSNQQITTTLYIKFSEVNYRF